MRVIPADDANGSTETANDLSFASSAGRRSLARYCSVSSPARQRVIAFLSALLASPPSGEGRYVINLAAFDFITRAPVGSDLGILVALFTANPMRADIQW